MKRIESKELVENQHHARYIQTFIARIQEAQAIKVTNFKRTCRIQIVTQKVVLTPVFRVAFEELKQEVP